MRFRTWISAAIMTSLASGLLPAQSKSVAAVPHSERRGHATQLIVDGKALLALAGELHNNSATSLEHMKPVWPRLAKMHGNTVLSAVSWAMLEPVEARFDFTRVDGLIPDARSHQLRLVPLWFGSWENSWSSYAPDWVKRDLEKYPRV